MPSPRRVYGKSKQTAVRVAFVFSAALAGMLFTVRPAQSQIMTVTNLDGRRLFVNSEPPAIAQLKPTLTRPNIYLQGEIGFMQPSRRAMSIDRDGADQLVREAAERHKVDPALIRAVIETESNWNPGAYSRKGRDRSDAIDSHPRRNGLGPTTPSIRNRMWTPGYGT